jgi:pectate lyase
MVKQMNNRNKILQHYKNKKISIMRTIKLFFGLLIFLGLAAQAFALTVTKSGGWLESAYVQWSPVSGKTNAADYTVTYTGGGKTNQAIDNALIRHYSVAGYLRADIPGLKAGTYSITVSGGNETATVSNITVTAHDRSGFAHSTASGSFGEANGAYNADGTLKTNAKVIYLTGENAQTVAAEIKTASNKTTACTGIQAILTAQGRGYSDPLVIRIIGKITDSQMSGNLNGSTYLQVKGSSAGTEMNVTLEGIGNDATMQGWGILIRNSTNVEVRNIAVMGDGDDGISIDTDNKNIWLHNCDIFYGVEGSGDKAKGDGGIDCKKSAWITISYNHYWDSGKCNLLSNGGETPAYHTFHHNFFDHSDSRHPRVRDHWVHVYNNYYVGIAKYGIGAAKGCPKIFAENNYFLNCKNPMLISGQGTDIAGGEGSFSGETGGMIKAYNNKMEGSYTFVPYSQNNTEFDAYVVTSRTATVPSTVKAKQGGCTYDNFDTVVRESNYPCKIDPVDDVPAVIQQWAGRCEHGDLQFQFTDADNSDSKRMKGISDIIANYTPAGEIVVYNPTTGNVVNTSVPTIALQSGNTSQNLQAGETMTNLVYKWGGTATAYEATYQTNGGTASSTKPGWLNVTSSNGTVTFSGEPVVVNNASTTYTITVKGKAGTSTSSALTATITVVPLTPGTLTLTSANNTNTQSVEAGHAITNIVYTWAGGATGATVTELNDAGLTSNVNATDKTVTISGTPVAAAGTDLSYTVATTGGSSQTSLQGTIHVIASTSPSVTLTSGNTSQTVIQNKPITAIVYTAGGTATDISVTGLPNGLVSKNDLVLTISGTPTATGVYNYIVTAAAADGKTATLTGTITVTEAVACNLSPFTETFNSATALNAGTDESGYVTGSGSPTVSNGILTMTGARWKTKLMNLTGSNVTLTVKVRPESTGNKHLQIALDKEGTNGVSGLGNYTMTNLEDLVGNADFATIVISITGGTESSYIQFRTESSTTVEIDEITITQTCAGGEQQQVGCGNIAISDWVYGQAPATPQVSSDCQGTNNVSYKYVGINGTVYAESAIPPVNVGEYRITATFPATTVYSEATISDDFMIGKATPTAEMFNCSDDGNSNYIYEYDGNAHSVSVTIRETVVGMGQITVRYNGSTTAPSLAGIYTIGVSVMEGDNYYATSEDIEMCTLEITAPLATPEVTLSQVSNTSFKLSWEQINGANGYEVKVCPLGATESNGVAAGTSFTQTFNDYSGSVGTDITAPFMLGSVIVNATVLTDSDGKDKGAVQIKNGSGTAGNISYTKYLDLKGGGSTALRSVEFAVDGAGTLTVYSNAKESDRTLVLWDGTNSSTNTENTATFEITAAGTYYLYSNSGGIRIYAIDFVGKAIEASESSSCIEENIDDPNVTGITIDELEPNTVYTYLVRAKNSLAAVSAYSAIATVMTTLEAITPLTVPNVTLGTVTANSFDLSWNAVDGADGYVVEVCHEEATESVGGSESEEEPITITASASALSNSAISYTADGGNIILSSEGTIGSGTSNSSYSWRPNENPAYLVITAKNGKYISKVEADVQGNNNESGKEGIGAMYDALSGSWVAGQTFILLPGNTTSTSTVTFEAPEGTNITACKLGRGDSGTELGGVVLTVGKNTVRIFEVRIWYKSTDNGSGSSEPICDEYEIGETSITINGLDPETTYTYKVTAVRGEETASSEPETVITLSEEPSTPLTAPTNVIHNETTVTANSFELSWGEVVGADGYVVEVCHEEDVTGDGGSEPGSGEPVIKSLTLNQSEVASLSDGNAGSTLKDGNGITISQIGMKKDGGGLQLNNNNSNLSLTNDALLVYSSETAIDSIVVKFASNDNSNTAQPYVGFSANAYTIGTGTFVDASCDASQSVTGKTFEDKKYICPPNTKSVIFVRANGKACDGDKSSEKTIIISDITVYLVPESNSGSDNGSGSTTTEPDCGDSPYETNATSITINGLDPETEYTYKVKAVKGIEGESGYEVSGYSEVGSVTTSEETSAPLTIPTNLTVSNKTATSFDLTWDAVADATGYEVQVCPPDDVIAYLGSTTKTNGAFTLSSGELLFTGANAGNSDASCSPAGVSATVYRTDSGNDFVLELVSTTASIIKIGGRSSGGSSDRTLASYSINGSSLQTEGRSGQITGQGCTTEITVSGLSLKKGDKIAFTFNGNTQISYFIITPVSAVSACEVKYTPTDNSVTVEGLTSGITGTYRVKAVKGTKKSDYSAPITVTTKVTAPAPTGLTAFCGQTLADVNLPTGWSWVNPSTSVGTVGAQSFLANYAGNDDYLPTSNVEATIKVTLAKVTGVNHSNVIATSFDLSWETVHCAESYVVKVSTGTVANLSNFSPNVTKNEDGSYTKASGSGVVLETPRLGDLTGATVAIDIEVTSSDKKLFVKVNDNNSGNSSQSIGDISATGQYSFTVNQFSTGDDYIALRMETDFAATINSVTITLPDASPSINLNTDYPVSSGTETAIIGLDPNVKYYYQVKAISGTEESAYSDRGTVTTMTATFTWSGSDNDWNNASNWYSGTVPTAESDVIIPYSAEGHYPILKSGEANNCRTITFEPGAEIGRQDLLTYEKAYVQSSFGEWKEGEENTNGPRNRWHMLSSPLKGVVTGDFAYGGYPKTFLRQFNASETQEIESVAMGTWKNAYSDYDIELKAGEGFALWVNGGTEKGYLDIPEEEASGLGQTKGIIQLPFFDDEVLSAYHRIHTYDDNSGKSTFTAVNGDLEPVESPQTTVQRSTESYKLNDANVSVPVEFSKGTDFPFAFIGNPFMSTIDFAKIYEASKDGNEYPIKNAYKIWNGVTFVEYSSLSGTDEGIAPQQAFLVEKAEGYNDGDFNINFTIAGLTTSGLHATLRSSSLPADKLDIVASNDKGSVLTYIAKREFGSLTFGNSDTRKLVTGINAMPEIYSLKESSSGGLIAAGTNVINTDNTLIPLGLSTSWEGNIALTFKGMDRYDAQIKFIDLAAGTETDLTGLDAYEYPFDYSPAKDTDNKPVANENRFFIQFAPTVPTGLTDVIETVRVYNDKQAVYVVSSDKINQVFIYDLRGVLVYANDRVESSHLTVPKEFNRSEVYIVKVATEKGVKNVKLINK